MRATRRHRFNQPVKIGYLTAFMLAPHFCLAQQITPVLPALTMDALTASSSSTSIVAVAPTAPTAGPKPLTSRWLDLTTLSHTERYRAGFAVGGTQDFQNAQQRSLIQGKIKLDEEGRYDIGFRASSGRYFNWAFGNYTGEDFVDRIKPSPTFLTPAESLERTRAIFTDPTGVALLRDGIKSNGWQFYMRELYVSATPVKPVGVEYGSFGIERGYGSEITTFDEDGYLSGERVRFNDRHLFFDEVSFTNAYFGDLATPNLFERGGSLTKANYRQVAVKRRLNPEFALSGEYTRLSGTNTLREAVVMSPRQNKGFDSVRLEVYERVNRVTFAGLAESPIGPIAPISVAGASGFAVTVAKKLAGVNGDCGFATVDNDYSVYANSRFIHATGFSLNGDTYGIGNRPFVHASYQIAPGVSTLGFYTHEVGSTRVQTLNQQGWNAGVTFDFKAMVNKEKLVF